MYLLPVLLVEPVVPEVRLHDGALQLEVYLREEVRDGDDRPGDGGDVDHPWEERVREEHAVGWGGPWRPLGARGRSAAGRRAALAAPRAACGRPRCILERRRCSLSTNVVVSGRTSI